MNLLMAATPLAMQQCGLPFASAALVLQWHVIGMFAPGFFTGSLIKRFGTLPIMGCGVLLNLGCIAVALSGRGPARVPARAVPAGVGWNFLFTGSTTLSLSTYRPEERDKAQGALNFFVMATLACTSLASGVLVTTQGWSLLNWGSLVPVLVTAGHCAGWRCAGGATPPSPRGRPRTAGPASAAARRTPCRPRPR
jgi:MFS family permease